VRNDDVLELGERSKPLRIVLKSQGFGAAMRIRPGGTMTVWPEGTTVDLILAHKGTTWTWAADVNGDLITWSVDAATTAPVPGGADAKIVIKLPGALPVEWYDGAVVRP
jgi:hypothetical protein